MARTARVHSIDTVRDFRASLCEFAKDTKDTLCAIDMHIRRTFDWLDERGKYWHREIKVRQEEVVRAKIELTQRKYANRDGRGPGCSDQERALRKAQARLKEAEEKAAACKKWGPLLKHAVMEYQGPARGLAGMLDTDVLHSLALLDQKLTALEAYLSVSVPTMEPLPAASSNEMTSAAAGDPTPPLVPTPEDAELAAQHVPEPTPQ